MVEISQSYSQKYNVTFFYGSLCSTINITNTDTHKSLRNAIYWDINAAGGSRGGEKVVKEDTNAGSSSLKTKSKDKCEEAMDWEADTKDVLEQLLHDDVTISISSVEGSQLSICVFACFWQFLTQYLSSLKR